MKSEEALDKLKELAKKYEARITIDAAKDGSYIDCSMRSKTVDLYFVLTKFNDTFFIYSFNNDMVSSDIFGDIKDDTTSDLLQRQNSILLTAESFLQNKVAYRKAPSFFNRKRGYIQIEVDGHQVKVWQKSNKLDLAEG